MSNLGRFRLIVPAANAKPSPSIGQTLGPLGINMMAFCKEFNARTSKIRPGVPVQDVQIQPPHPQQHLVPSEGGEMPHGKRACRKRDSGKCDSKGGKQKKFVLSCCGVLKIYHIAKCKSMDWPLIGLSLQGICRSLIGSAKAMGIQVTPQLLPAFSKRDYTPVEDLEQMRKDLRQKRKAARRAASKT